MKVHWYSKKWIAIIGHLIFWSLFLLSPYLLRPVMDADGPMRPRHRNNDFYLLNILNNIPRLLLFYANAYLLIPRLVYRKKYISYLLALLVALVIMLFWDRLLFSLLTGRDQQIWNFFVYNFFPFVFIVTSSIAFRIIRDKMEDIRLAKERETETLKTELSFLRSQISPHFMFNVLNNMVALARRKSDDLEPSLLKLSSLLRYMLYETNEEKVLLEKEISYLQNYIDLQAQRFGKHVQINTVLQTPEKHYSIEPMLLIPFVENAFKHGTGNMNHSQIDLSLSVENDVLQFSVRNTYNDTIHEVKDHTSGIGLANVKRRLALLYHKNHKLDIEAHEGWFTVFLQLNLH